MIDIWKHLSNVNMNDVNMFQEIVECLKLVDDHKEIGHLIELQIRMCKKSGFPKPKTKFDELTNLLKIKCKEMIYFKDEEWNIVRLLLSFLKKQQLLQLQKLWLDILI